MTDHKVGTPEEWLAARTELLEREKELTRRSAERHDVTMFCSSRAPLEKLQAYKRRMGWQFPWVSSLRNHFDFDFDVSFTEDQQRDTVTYNYRSQDFTPILEAQTGPVAEQAATTWTSPAQYLREAPGMSAFALSEGVVYHTYSAYARGLDGLWGLYQWLDRAPKGRNEGDPPQLWMRRHDEYESATGERP